MPFRRSRRIRFILSILFCLVVFSFLINKSTNHDEANRDIHGEFNPKGCPIVREEPNNGLITVHVVAHSHQDVGWVRTADEYYNDRVRQILNTTINALLTSEVYRFTQVEMAYFSRWWSELKEASIKARIRDLVCQGHLQFAIGGWVMADEATVYYEDEIDQLTRGRLFLRELFGDCAQINIAWQIDTFGHARDRAYLFSKAGFDALIVQRIDWKEKIMRRNKQTLDFLWDVKHKVELKNQTLFTHVLYDTYCYPDGACMDSTCQVGPLNEMTVKVIDTFVQAAILSSRVPHILLPMGCDFTFVDAQWNFNRIDELLRRLNVLMYKNIKNIQFVYSTPTCYSWALNRAMSKMNESLPTHEGDFFPYADQEESYWTGYFTSRPTLKRLVRQQSRLLKMAEQVR